jgi:hypothetical protein
MDITLFTEDELKLLYPDKIQREIFIKGINQLIKIISNRTVNAPFIALHESY